MIVNISEKFKYLLAGLLLLTAPTPVVSETSGNDKSAPTPVVSETSGNDKSAGPTPEVSETTEIPADHEVSETTGVPAFPPTSSEALAQFEYLYANRLPGRILFTSNIEGFDRIYLLDLELQRTVTLIDGPGNNYYPSYSPDGKWITFTSDRDGNPEIYIAKWDGSEQTRLTENDTADDNPSWSPNGSRIIYYSETGDGATDLFSISRNGGVPKQITKFSGRNVTPRWSPDGRYISYTTNRFWPGWDVCLWDIQNKKESCILSGRSSYCRATWSPSGEELAYSTGDGDEIKLGIMNVRDQQTQELKALAGREYDAVWSPLEGHIVFVAEDTAKSGFFNLHILERKSRKVAQLLKSPSSVRYPSWAALNTSDLEAERIAEELRNSGDADAKPIPTVTPLEIPDSYVPPYLRNKLEASPSPTEPKDLELQAGDYEDLDGDSSTEHYEEIEWEGE